MASTTNTSSPNGRQKVRRSNGDSIRWAVGLLLLCVGVYAASAVFFSFFSWASDQSGLLMSTEERAMQKIEPENLCGWSGAKLARLLVDNSFGLFGILIPVIVILAGVRIIRRQPLRFNRSFLPLLMVTLLGSLTLGFCFADRWSLCCSTGWGGTFGIETAALLRMYIGTFGTLILLLGCWILTGVFINRNFINTVNSAGNAVVDRSEKIVEIVRHKVAPGHAPDSPAADLADTPAPVRTAAADEPAAPVRREAEGPLRPDTPPAEPSHPAPAPQSEHVSDRPAGNVRRGESRLAEPDPFVELTPDGQPVAPEPAGPEPVPAPAVDPGPFTEVDLRPAEGRIVMGRGGLVELERPAPRPAAAPAPTGDAAQAETDDTAARTAEERRPAGRTADPDDPFTEFIVGDKEPAESASAAPAPVEAQPAAAEPEGVVVTVEANEARLVDERKIPTESYDPLKDLENYRKPPVTLLEDYISDSEVTDEEIFDNKTRIEETLKNFGIPIVRIKATVGPTVTLYEIVQAQGVKISKIQGLQNDIAQSLKAESGIRIIAPIPGRGTIGIEVPNRNKQVVSMYSAVRSLRFQESKAELPVVMGRTIQNENYVFDLAKMPHLLVAGATGQGKSVGLNAIITSLLYRKHPAQLKFVMIDPKMVEFSLYARIERHFLAKMESEDEAIITDPKKAVYTLNSLCIEMDNRLEMCKNAGAKNIKEYNDKFVSRRLNPLKGHRYLPYIVVVIDEFADLIMMAKEVELPVIRLAQKARAVGIHLIIATQRPSVDVITGKIKANFPSRIAFRVVQRIDSQTIIDQPGANQLIGRGDMLISKDGELTRVQCALVETAEVERIVEYISKQQGYTSAYALPDYTPEGGEGAGLGSEEASAPMKYDSLFAEIAREAVSSGSISTSMIQRNYEVGFNRAGRIMMQLERAGIVGRQQGAKPRDILFHDLPSLEAKLQDLGVF
ncbi:DNA translocase FtsK 4TM domain-containing protein [uncultured Alistipes sp.]|uniref:DNA translocase FtsK n=1 Tax=uncultured Alistipes sp. TaxID=538949 RepID=UPI002628CB8A|nr:DNA translocase FtsK 4TM domain-containing protein [uncultured Alistipes sp.]